MAIKTCKSCGQPFNTTFVAGGKKRWMACRTRCLECFPFGASRADPLEVRRKKNVKRQRAWVARRREEDGRSPFKTAALQKKQVVVSSVGGCQLCGYIRCFRAVTFHHLRDKVHGLTLREFQRSWKGLIPELRKCVVLCHNCHAEVHDGLVDTSRLIDLNVAFSAVLDELVYDTA